MIFLTLQEQGITARRSSQNGISSKKAKRAEFVKGGRKVGYISERTPPFLIMHGDKDDIVPINQSELLYKALVQAGVPVNYYIVRGAGHGGPEFSAANVVEIVSSFFDKHLKSSFTGVRKEQSASE